MEFVDCDLTSELQLAIYLLQRLDIFGRFPGLGQQLEVDK